ncbi:MAG: phage major capsid protein [Mogibacterium sp.]|nr:phage major capsid protein [Mogibacterium sp.]
MNLNDLLQERASVYDKMKELNAKYGDSVMDSADKDTYGTLEAKFDELTERIENQKKATERARIMDQANEAAQKPADKKPEVSKLFARALSGHPAAVEAYRQATIYNSDPVNYTLGTDATAGSLTAPMEFREELIRGLDDDLFMRRISRKIGGIGAAQSLGFPQRLTSATDATWTTEVASATEEQALTYGRREFKPNRLAKLLKISKTLMAHAPMAEGVLLQEMRYNIGTVQEAAYLNGDGSGEPLGVFYASNDGVPSTRDVSADNTTTAFTMDGLLNALYSLKGQYQAKASWIFHRDAVKMLAKIKNGEGIYLWQPSTQVGQPDRLFGHPVYMSEYAPNTFTTGKYVGVVGDFNYYWICDADTLTVQVLNELYAVTNQTGYIYEYAGDGAPVLGEAFARVKLA